MSKGISVDLGVVLCIDDLWSVLLSQKEDADEDRYPTLRMDVNQSEMSAIIFLLNSKD